MRRAMVWMLGAAVAAGPIVGGSAAAAQYGNGYGDGGYRNGYRQTRPYDDRYDRQRYGNGGYYNGNGYNRGDYDRHHGGIGPGKGALIGGGAGALLGGLLGGGLKGALIGGGVGAGGGALLGKAHQDSQRRDYRDRYDRYGNPY